MELSNWLVFAAISLATCFSPGPAVLLAVSNSVSFGPRKAIWSSAGNVIGVSLVAVTTVLGLGVLLKTSSVALAVMKALGAAYLIYLGVRQWRQRFTSVASAQEVARAPMSDRQTFMQGLVVAMTNPKAFAYLTALFPQFMVSGASAVQRFALLTATYATSSVLAHLSYIFAAKLARRWLADGATGAWVSRALGALFVGMGVFMLSLSPVPR